MKIKLMIIGLVFLLASAFSFNISAEENNYEPQTVRHVGSGQTYSTIQNAIDASNDGDEIAIHDGTYNERISIIGFNGLTLYGYTGRTGAIIDDPGSGTYYDTCYLKSCENITIHNLTFTDAADYSSSIYWESECYNIIIKDCIIKNSAYRGIYQNDANNPSGEIYDNYIYGCSNSGIFMGYEGNITIYHNNVSGCGSGGIEEGWMSPFDYISWTLGTGAGEGGNWVSNYDSSSEGAYDNNNDGVADDEYDGFAEHCFMSENGWETFEGIINTAPNQPTNNIPSNSESNVDVYTYLNVTVTDDDGNSMDVSFYWTNHTLIDSANSVSNNTVASINFQNDWLNHNTTYNWYVNISDGTNITHSSDYSFTTCKSWDTNADGAIDYLDVSLVTTYFGQTCNPGENGWDIHANGECDYLDVSMLVTYYST